MDTKFVQGADRLAQRIRTIRERLFLPPLVEEIGSLLWKRTLVRFDREVDPDERPWPELSEATKKRQDSESGRKKKLVQTRALRESIRIIKGGAGSIFTNTGAGVRIGIDGAELNNRGVRVAEYGRVHQRGYGPHNIPARRFLGIGRLDVKAVDSFLRRKGQQVVEE